VTAVTQQTPQALRQCRTCRHFRNDAAFLEAAFSGLASMSSGYGSVRADDGICLRHDRYLGARSSCADYTARSAQSHPADAVARQAEGHGHDHPHDAISLAAARSHTQVNVAAEGEVPS
jgi:hypothetical protein